MTGEKNFADRSGVTRCVVSPYTAAIFLRRGLPKCSISLHGDMSCVSRNAFFDRKKSACGGTQGHGKLMIYTNACLETSTYPNRQTRHKAAIAYYLDQYYEDSAHVYLFLRRAHFWPRVALQFGRASPCLVRLSCTMPHPQHSLGGHFSRLRGSHPPPTAPHRT